MRLLLIEDETALADALTEILRQNGYLTDAVYHGSEGLEYARTGAYDLLILDIMLPGMDGLSILRTLRRENFTMPVLLLTAKSDLQDIVAGLDAGSDDYLPKPFSTQELLARLRALLRRGQRYEAQALTYEDLSLNKDTCELSSHGNSIRLGLKEYRLMEVFLSSPRQIFPKELLISKVWGLDTEADYNNVEVYVSFLRQKLNLLDTRVQIKTNRGIGYSLEAAS